MEYMSFIEKSIAIRLVKAILKDGNMVTVYNGGEKPELKNSTNRKEILKTMNQTGIDEIVLRDKDEKHLGWIQLVYGNDWDLVSDYSVALEEMLKPVNDWVNKNGY